MSSTLTAKATLGALPVKLSWQMASVRLHFDSLMAVFVGPALGLDVTYTGPLLAEMVYVDKELRRDRRVSFAAQVSMSDSPSANRSDWQFRVELPKDIFIRNTSYLTVYLALPPSAKLPTDKTVTSTEWRIRYGLNGNYE